MIDDLDKLLREALRKRSAPMGFAERVLGRLPEHDTKRYGLQRAWWISGALAASLAVAMTLHQLNARVTEREGLRARTELMEALRVTSAKLDLAYQAVQEPAKTPVPGGSS